MLIQFLKKDFLNRKKKNSQYSIRAYGRDLNVDPSTLAKVLSGRRKLTFQMAQKITDSLTIDETVKSMLLLTYADTKRSMATDEDFFVPDEKLSAELMSKWEYYTILSYLEIDPEFNPEKIAQIFQTDVRTVQDILENFIVLGIATKEGPNLKLTGKTLTAPSTFNRKSLINAHRENIQKALSLLEERDLTTSDFSGITFAVPTSKLPQAIEQIRKFRRSFAEFVSPRDQTHHDSVYRLNIQFFPLIPPVPRPPKEQVQGHSSVKKKRRS